jgi:hypothetical protein
MRLLKFEFSLRDMEHDPKNDRYTVLATIPWLDRWLLIFTGRMLISFKQKI